MAASSSTPANKEGEGEFGSVSALLRLTLEDVQSEVEFWSTAVVCYVMGANPPWETLTGYVKRIWGAYGYDKISFLSNGVFLVRFKTKESQQLVLQKGYFLFDNIPLLVRAWEEGSSLTKEAVRSVPIWIRIPGLPLKFWGCLDKISSLVGKFVRCDEATLDKTWLGYARVLVEVQVDQSFPEHISFLDEKGQEVTVVIEYDWKPDGGSSLIDSTSKNDQFSSRLGSRGTSAGSSSSLPSQTVTGLPVKSTEGGSTTFGKVFKDASKEVSQIPSSAFLISSPAALSNSISSTGPLREESGSTSSSVQASHKIGLTSQTYMSTSSQSPQNSAPSPADNSKSDGFTQTVTPTEVSFPDLSKSATGASNAASNVPTERQSAIFTAPSVSLPDSGGTSGPTNTTTIDSNETSKAPPEMQPVAFTLPFSNTGGTDVPTKTATIESSETTNIPLEKQSTAFTIPPVSLSVPGGSLTGKDNSDATISQEDEMEEVAPETNRVSDFSLGSFAQFGLGGSSVNTTTTKSSPFGVSLPSTPPQSMSSSPFTVPHGQLFHPASFNFQSPTPQQSQSPTTGGTSGPFGSATPPQQSPAASGFGQPGQIGFGGQQAMGSVLGSFGQSRQIGAAIPGSGFGGAPSAPTGGFAAPSTPTGGFAGIAAKSGGFAGISGTAGGFAGLGGTAGGFGGAATPGGGFAAASPGGGGFGAAANTGGFAAAAGGGGGFGGFSSQGTSGFSAFGGGATGGRPPSELFTQMRR